MPFHLRRDHINAVEYRAARARAFETCAEVSRVAATA
jgi:putative transposase